MLRFALVGALLAAGPAFAADFQPRPHAIEAHMRFLADDLLEGREPGHPGYDIAAAYVAAQLEAIGVRPAGDKGGYMQTVPMIADSAQSEGRITLRDAKGKTTKLQFGADYLPFSNPFTQDLKVSAPLVFAGFGIVAPEQGRDDFAGLDVKGKIVVVLRGAPKSWQSEVRAHYGSTRYKRVAAAKRGAAGIITVYTPTMEKVFAFDRAKATWRSAAMTWADKDGKAFVLGGEIPFPAVLSQAGGRKLFAGAAVSYDDIIAAAESPDGKVATFALSSSATIETKSASMKLDSANVVGMIEGADPKLKHEYVVLSAHLDHLGVTAGADGDTINNGAMDNAAGIATMLEVARGFAESPLKPKRSLIFLAVTAEEKGLVGADYFARNPTVPKGAIVANVNLDMPILSYDFTDVIAFGAERSDLGPIVKNAAGRLGVALSPDPMPDEGTFVRSDHFRFVEQGVPAVFLATGWANGGEAAEKDFLEKRYHQPADDMSQPINFQAGAKFAAVNFEIARDIANAEKRPAWKPGDFFGGLFASGR